MGTPARIGVLTAVVAAAVVALIAFRGGESANTGSSPAASSSVRRASTGTAARPAPVARSAITVNSRGPVGGVRTIVARAGERIVIAVRSDGYSGEIHLHGFDIAKDVRPGGTAVFDLGPRQTGAPRALGVVELEMEAISVRIARLEIEPS